MRARSFLVTLLAASACTFDPAGISDGSDRIDMRIELESFVYVATDASDDQVRRAVDRQLQSSLGAFRELAIDAADGGSASSLDPGSWVRTPLTVIGPDGAAEGQVERITYRYHGAARVATDRIPNGPVDLTLLFGDAAARRDELVPACTDSIDMADDSIGYHFHPRTPSCRAAIDAEQSDIADATQKLHDPSSEIARRDRERLFVRTRARLTEADSPAARYPEYDRLWGFSGDPNRTQLVVYSFFGVDRDLGDPDDNGLQELLRFQRTLRRRFPGLAVSHTAPHALLLDFWLDGAPVAGVTFDDVESWILDSDGFPARATNAAQRDALRRQVVERFAERWVHWTIPVQVSSGAITRTMTVELRTYYGPEDGSPEIRQRAQWRYLEGFWHGDVFAYTGHSQFGRGPLDPGHYNGGNFPDRYQVMLFNSCLSSNDYDQDFIGLHPRSSENLDVVVNGLAPYWYGMGEATAEMIASLIDGEQRPWTAVLESMEIGLPGERGFDPLRVVNGERDNVYTPSNVPLTVTY